MPGTGALAGNLLAFGRLLRRAGLPVGAADMLAGAEALSLIELGDRVQAKAALRATLVRRREHFEIFDQAFALFWRDRSADRGGPMEAGAEALEKAPAAARRVSEALGGATPPAPPRTEARSDASLTVSAGEQLRKMDFEAMGAEEIAAAKQEIRRLTLPLDARPTRRFRPASAGRRVDLRATLRQSLRQGGEVLDIRHAERVTRPPPLVVICDISGSMARYAQILLHFLHAVTNDRDRVAT
ncbi:MAG: hypothetical protein JWP20_484, partial [Roseomonas sp.]|nr:hypothetical protein [Roseomonas sp.]